MTKSAYRNRRAKKLTRGDMSLYGLGESLKKSPALLGQVAAAYERLAAEAEDNQPVSSRLTDQLHAVAKMLRGAEAAAQEWYTTFRGEHGADIDRPRPADQGETT